MNSDIMRQLAETFAQRLRLASADAAARVELAHELAYSRPALPSEIKSACTYVRRYNQQALEAGFAPNKAEAEAWLSYARTILGSHEFFYVE
jgi:hypothetical protein